MPPDSKIAIIGFGAFGQLVARHLRDHAPICVCDPVVRVNDLPQVTAEVAAQCEVVILAMPLSRMREVLLRIAGHLRPGTLVIDVCSVKLRPAQLMLELLPEHVELVSSHPLFGPQSAADGLSGHRIAWCPLRGRRHLMAVAMMRKLGLRVMITTPEQHDRDMAVVQGLTHLIARSLSKLGPMPSRLATASFQQLLLAAGMVQGDSPELLRTILNDNPYAKEIRDRFLTAASEAADVG
ncbi:prephenate dehydrogenase [Paracoccus sp. 11-3]|uniref:Prephenate dehydrogenase n=1 Tax=Paracoccus amoyensis TaxID=2760093 RepID=A0A926GIR7_9RHOB|nr:prephenate dehydrogenase [Paracoccus amoyensis]MBC9247994.1 prephenate dehydrogenase [Paracoccus amoyensis]